MSAPSSTTAEKHGPCCLKKRTQTFETRCLRKLLRIFCLKQKTNDWVRSKVNFLVGPQEPLLAAVKEWTVLERLSHATTASPKLSCMAPWRVGDAVVGRGNAGWTTSKSGHVCPCQNCSQGLLAEKTERGSLLNCPSCSPSPPPPNSPIGQGTELNCAENLELLKGSSLMCDVEYDKNSRVVEGFVINSFRIASGFSQIC